MGFFSETGRLFIDKNHDSIKQRKEFEKFWDFLKKIRTKRIIFFIMQAAIFVDPDSSIE